MALRAIAQDCYGLAFEQAQITVFVIILFDHVRVLLLYLLKKILIVPNFNTLNCVCQHCLFIVTKGKKEPFPSN